ncbi:FIG00899427: hypothetical protein [hydrothermal vent metagenome]|uniref:Gamma-butyrobetaine hydroxylase-like N-terminal domain-containing protein n=1 Tax=hydrothermal vent metagenome TaxID=652676 RepID=A0A3B0XFZ9_9ZZZZ
MADPKPTNINLHQKSRILEIDFDDGKQFKYSTEYLRVHSPSAEVRGHGPGEETLQVGKSDVNITAIEPVGVYAVKLVFDDNHDSGLYTWSYLYELGANYEAKWQNYLQRLKDAGHKHADLN